MDEDRSISFDDLARFLGLDDHGVDSVDNPDRLVGYRPADGGDGQISMQDFVEFLKDHGVAVPEDPDTERRKVLVVEDDPGMAELIRKTLERHDYTVQVAFSAFEAGAAFGRFRPRLMTLDLKMPGLRGIDVLRFLKKKDRLKDVRVLVVTAMEEGEIAEALAAGAHDVLRKPFDNAHLVDKLNALARAG
jgi:CheY-like chemotaxis protein